MDYLKMSPKKILDHRYDDTFLEGRTDLFCDLVKLALEAEEAQRAIVEEYTVWLKYSPRFKTLVWSDDDEFDFEYLNKLWIWETKYWGLKFSVHCSLNGIYKLLRKDYMIKQGLIEPEKNHSIMIQAFRDFVEFTKSRIEIRKTLDYDPRLPHNK